MERDTGAGGRRGRRVGMDGRDREGWPRLRQVLIGASRRLETGFEPADLLRHAVEEGQDQIA